MGGIVGDWVRQNASLLLVATLFACLLMIGLLYRTRPARRPHRPGRHRVPDPPPY